MSRRNFMPGLARTAEPSPEPATRHNGGPDGRPRPPGRIGGYDLLGGHPVSDEIEDERDRHAQAANAGLAHHEVGIKCDSLEAEHGRLPGHRPSSVILAQAGYSLWSKLLDSWPPPPTASVPASLPKARSPSPPSWRRPSTAREATTGARSAHRRGGRLRHRFVLLSRSSGAPRPDCSDGSIKRSAGPPTSSRQAMGPEPIWRM